MRILITQRSDDQVRYKERRDGLDQNWFATLQELLGPSITVFPVPNDPSQLARFLDQTEPNAVVLTGGNDPDQVQGGSNVDLGRDAVEHEILNHAKQEELSVLAVCRGLQFLNLYCGGDVSPVSGHVAVAHELTTRTGQSLLVNSFHNQAIEPNNLAPDLQAVAWDDSGHIEAAHHEKLPWFGIMWHPERSQPDPRTASWLRDHLRLHTRFLT